MKARRQLNRQAAAKERVKELKKELKEKQYEAKQKEYKAKGVEKQEWVRSAAMPAAPSRQPLRSPHRGAGPRPGGTTSGRPKPSSALHLEVPAYASAPTSATASAPPSTASVPAGLPLGGVSMPDLFRSLARMLENDRA
jgi:hypothetical protein